MNTTEGSWGDRWAAAWQLRLTDAAAALSIGKALSDEAILDGNDDRQGRAALLQGSCHWRLSSYSASLRCLLGALELLDDEDRWHRACTLLDLGTVNQFFGLYDGALARLLSALQIFDEIADEPGRSNVFNNLGIVFWKRGDLEESTRAYQRSVEIRLRLNDAEGVAACRNNIAKVLTEQGSFDLALRELAYALEAWEELGTHRGVGMALNNIGIVHYRRGELDVAAEHFEASLQLKQRIGDEQGTCETRTHLGRLYANQGRTEEGLAMLCRAVEDSESFGTLSELAEACSATSEVYEDLGDHAAALHWFRRFHAADRAQFNERSAERLQGLQIAFQLERAEHEGSTDGLTGLANRRTLDRQLRREFISSRSSDRELSVALLDLDAFKAVNDRFGHGVGDDVLRAMASLLRDHTRATDLPARYGGEEFAVIFPDTGLADATRAAVQLCDRVRAHPWDQIHPSLSVTVSVGVASANDVNDIETLLANADRHLYLAKHTGKDRVRS